MVRALTRPHSLAPASRRPRARGWPESRSDTVLACEGLSGASWEVHHGGGKCPGSHRRADEETAWRGGRPAGDVCLHLLRLCPEFTLALFPALPPPCADRGLTHPSPCAFLGLPTGLLLSGTLHSSRGCGDPVGVVRRETRIVWGGRGNSLRLENGGLWPAPSAGVISWRTRVMWARRASCRLGGPSPGAHDAARPPRSPRMWKRLLPEGSGDAPP